MTTKRQHLVWRDYLAPWTDNPNSTDGNIACYYKDQRKIIHVGIENIGVEGYAYDVSMMNDIDKKIVIAYLSNWLKKNSNLDVKSITVDTKNIFKRDYIEKCFICPIENNGQSILKSLYNLEFPFTGPTKLEILIQLYKIIIQYQLYGLHDEKEFYSLCNQLLSKDEENKNCDRRYLFYEFFAAQMLRTWRSREAVFNSIKETVEVYNDSNFANTSDAIFPFMMAIDTMILACSFCKNNYYIQIIKNKSPVNFITGDFPIINLKADYSIKCDDIKEMELYYPITPSIAIKCMNTIIKNEIVDLNDGDAVSDLNRKIFEAATKQVYAVSKNDLSLYL